MTHVDFTSAGFKQFAKMNRNLGARFIKGIILKCELAMFIEAHEAAGSHLDTTCQELHYENGVYLLLRKERGVWLITDIWSTTTPTSFTPVYFWTQIKRGASLILKRVLVAWRQLINTKTLEGSHCYR